LKQSLFYDIINKNCTNPADCLRYYIHEHMWLSYTTYIHKLTSFTSTAYSWTSLVDNYYILMNLSMRLTTTTYSWISLIDNYYIIVNLPDWHQLHIHEFNWLISITYSWTYLIDIYYIFMNLLDWHLLHIHRIDWDTAYHWRSAVYLHCSHHLEVYMCSRYIHKILYIYLIFNFFIHLYIYINTGIWL